MATINNLFWKRKKVVTLSTKGGVGKTTTSIHFCYHMKKKHSLVYQYVDADMQGSGTNHCLGRDFLISDCKGETNSERPRPIPENVKRMVLRLFKDQEPYKIPNTMKKSGFNTHMNDSAEFYDGFMIDTMGADAKASREALVYSDIAIVPVNPSGLVVSELHKVLDMVMLCKVHNPNLRVFIVFTRVVSSAKKIAREHIQSVNQIIETFLEGQDTTKENEKIHVCETVITERQDVYNNVDIGLNAFELAKGKTRDVEIQFDTLIDEMEYLYNSVENAQEVA
ncbi:ParA family protein [Pseudomonas aeruginosa]